MNSNTRNVSLLVGCQAMLVATAITLVALNGLAGLILAPVKSLATLPITCWVIGAAIATFPASLLMKRVGRVRGFDVGNAIGVIGALVCASGLWLGNFWLLCAGTLIFGAYNGIGQYYRFAAAEVAAPENRANSISWVLAGGLAGAVIGPLLSRYTVDALEPRYLGAYLGTILFLLAASALLRLVRIPLPTAEERTAKGRPLLVIAREPKFIVAVVGSAIGYAVMNFLMTATPLAMEVCGHPFDATAAVISAHAVGMMAPSFVTGTLIKRFGILPIMFVGALLNVIAIVVALAGIEVAHFGLSLLLVGVGWNFLFIGGTTLLTECCRPEERAKVQGANDLTVFVLQALSSLAPGVIVTHAGWEKVNLSALAPVVVVALAIGWLAWRDRAARVAA